MATISNRDRILSKSALFYLMCIIRQVFKCSRNVPSHSISHISTLKRKLFFLVFRAQTSSTGFLNIKPDRRRSLQGQRVGERQKTLKPKNGNLLQIVFLVAIKMLSLHVPVIFSTYKANIYQNILEYFYLTKTGHLN